MAPTNDLNAPAVAFLILSIVFLLLLILIWYRYLILWNLFGRRFYEEKRRGSRGRDHSISPRPRGPQSPRRSCGPQSPSLVGAFGQRIPGAFPQEYRKQPPSGPIVGLRDQPGLASRDEPMVEDLEEGKVHAGGEPRVGDSEKAWDVSRNVRVGGQDELLYRRREASPEPRQEERRTPRRSGNEATLRGVDLGEELRGERRGNSPLFEPLEDPPGAFHQGGRRVSFAGPESEVEPRNQRDERGGEREEKRRNTKDLNGVQEPKRRRDARNCFRDDNRPGNRGESEREHHKNERSRPEIGRMPDASGQNEEGVLDDLGRGTQEHRQPRSHFSGRDYRELYREPGYGPHRQSSLDSIRSDAPENERRRDFKGL